MRQGNISAQKPAEGSDAPRVIYSARVPIGRFLADSTIILIMVLALIGLTADIAVEEFGRNPMGEKCIMELLLLVAEVVALFFALDGFLWYAFGRERITVAGGVLAVENQRRLSGKVRTAALSQIEGIEIDRQGQLHIFSTVSRIRYLRHRGNIILRCTDGTRLRLCMSTDAAVLKSVSQSIRQSVPNLASDN